MFLYRKQAAGRFAGLSAVLAVLGSFVCAAQPMPSKLRQALKSNLEFSEDDLKAAEGGSAVTRVIDTGDPEDVFIAGAILMAASPSSFVERYRNITEFEASPSVPASGKFSSPPQESDMAGLVFTKSEVDDLRDCQPGDCDFKIADRGLQRIRSSVNWKSPDYVAQANRVIRDLWLKGLRAYQSKGDSALSEYHDSKRIFRVEEGLASQLEKSPFLYQHVPELTRYLETYPKGTLPASEDFFYWQKADFGLKPVHRITHVIIQKQQMQSGEGYCIASKMLYASHYFRSALEFRFLLPVQTPDKKPAQYVVVLQRSYVDGLGGIKGKMLRGPILSKTKDAMQKYLVSVKTKLEPQSRGS